MWTCHVEFILFKVIPLFSVPLSEPLDFNVSEQSSNSVNLSWKAIPTGKLRGFLSHYRLCRLKINSEPKDKGTMFHFHRDYVAKRSILSSRREETHISPLSVLTFWCIYNQNHIYMVVLTFWCFVFFFLECYNVSAFVTAYRLVNLTPGSKYNISLAAVTGAGEGPRVFHIINTPPENMTGNNLKPVWSVSVNTQDLNTSFPRPQISLFLPV